MKSKRVLTILLSLAIMMTFMPTLAFAAPAAGEFNANHQSSWSADEIKDGKLLVDPTCTSSGIVEVGCNVDGGICTHKTVTGTGSLGHDFVEKRFDTAEDFAVALVNNGLLSEKQAAEWLRDYGANVCYGYAKVCSRCGALEVTTEGSNHLYGLTATEHKEPAGTKACDASFTCAICNKAGAVNSTHNKTKSDAFHADSANLTVTTQPGTYCTVEENVMGVDVTAWERVTTYTCNACKQVVNKTHQLRTSPSAYAYLFTDSDLAHNMVDAVVKEATCTDPGVNAKVCATCGYEGPTQNTLPLNHSYTKEESFPATLISPAYTVMACERCGDYDWSTQKYTGKPLSSKTAYSMEVLWPKNCDTAGILKVTFSLPSVGIERVEYMTYDRSANTYKFFGGSNFTNYFTTDKDYFRGFMGELDAADAIEIPDIKPTGHIWAKADKVAEASCLIPEQEAMKCTICGDIKHPTTKVGKALGHEVEEVVVDATCGAAGYTYKVCTRCNQYLNEKGKTKFEVTSVPGDKFESPQKYNETKPVVKLGEKCQYEWTILEEATAFKQGTRAKVCTNTKCNHLEEATKESIAKKTVPVTVKAGKKKATVTVKPVEGAVKYQIKVNGKVKKTINKPLTSAKKVTIKKLKGGKKAKFQIVAFNAEGVKAASKTKSVKIKK